MCDMGYICWMGDGKAICDGCDGYVISRWRDSRVRCEMGRALW